MDNIKINERLREVESNLRIIQKQWIEAYEEILRLIQNTDEKPDNKLPGNYIDMRDYEEQMKNSN